MIRTSSSARTLLVGCVALSFTLLACSSSSGDGASHPTITPDRASTTTTQADSGGPLPNSPVPDPAHIEGPITGGRYEIPYLAMPAGYEKRYGYTEHEYFIDGEARAFGTGGTLGTDGRWDTRQGGKGASYKTRIVVRRPKRDADFNGTVVVEWLNVSAGRDSDPDFGFFGDELMKEGYGYIAVSAQKTGVEPGGLGMDIPGVPPEALAPLKTWDPKRYGSLSHPGDAYSYDIFSQAAKVALSPSKDSPMGGLPVKHLIATGESQSAFRMVTYVNAVEPVTHLFDGFLIHSRSDTAADLNDQQKAPSGVQIRSDSKVPVFQFETETDLDFLKFTKARQADAKNLATWEVAGTSHADRSTLDYGVKAGRRWTNANVDLSTECGQVNNGPQQPVVQAAFAALSVWVDKGTHPPKSPLVDIGADGAIVRDADGIAKGGIRTPAVDAPTSVLTGKSRASSIICVLFGSETSFTKAQLAAHYPDHASYVAAVTKSANAAEADGFLLPSGAKAMIATAQAAPIP